MMVQNCGFGRICLPVTRRRRPDARTVARASVSVRDQLADRASLRNRVLVVAFFALVGGWGYWALLTTPIDAIPDLSDNQVIVFTDWPGRSPAGGRGPGHLSAHGEPPGPAGRAGGALLLGVRLLDDQRDLRGLGGPLLRALARAGAPEPARASRCPAGVVPTLGPGRHRASGHVFWYTVEGKGHSLRDLRSLQDWFIRYQLNAVPGVAEVASVGGIGPPVPDRRRSRTGSAPSRSRSRRWWTP